jgi:type I restriction enzyme S subunit
MSISRYESYKDSGLPWLREIPSHWDTIQSRRLFTLRKEKATENDRQLTASQKHGVIYQDDYMALEGQRVVQVLIGADILKHVEPNDFVISMRSFQGGIEWCGHRGSISSAYVMLIPSASIEVKFFSYLFKCKPYIQALQSTSNLVRDGQALRYDNFTLIHLPVVKYSEQEEIAAFLDRETAKIDSLVNEQQRLIDLLKEKQQAVISNVVTKGLNPAVPMKDSGIEWLGQVPAHWNVKRLRFIADVQSGIAKGKDNVGRKTITVPYLRVANVQDGFLDLEKVASIEIPECDLDRYLLRAGDVLMNEGGDYDKLGRGHIWRGEIASCIHQNHVFAVRPRAVTSEWLNEITGSAYAQFYFMTRSKQSTNLASISSTNLMELPVVLPPDPEQRDILALIALERTKFDALAAEAQSAINLLQERRTALISAAVTGKIDVRGLVEFRPEEVAAE